MKRLHLRNRRINQIASRLRKNAIARHLRHSNSNHSNSVNPGGVLTQKNYDELVSPVRKSQLLTRLVHPLNNAPDNPTAQNNKKYVPRIHDIEQSNVSLHRKNLQSRILKHGIFF